MKTIRCWIYGGLLVLAGVVAMWIFLAQERSATQERSHRAQMERHDALEARMTRESQEFDVMSAEEQTEHLRQARLENMRRRVTEARTPGEVAAAQVEYERELSR
jgi:hypothetical protein